MTTPFRSLAVAIALLLIAASPAAGQAIAFGEPPPIRERADPLAESYRVRLVSAWPQLPGGEGCENGGSETIEGILTRSGVARFSGTLVRTTRLLFCGAHATAGAACALELDGEGVVVMRGRVVPDERSPSGRALRVTWTPAAGHAARVTGGCGDDFEEKVERMYLTARHGAEFAVPNAGAAPVTERLEDYGWTVEVR